MKFIFLLTAFFLTGCSPNKTENENQLTKKDCNGYFQYDQILHYYVSIDEGDVWKVYEKRNKTKSEVKLLDILIQDVPAKMSDTTILDGIQQLNFKKTTIDAHSFAKIDEIFCERKHKESSETSCIAVYRDILIFKNKNHTIGVAKICFECGKKIIIGAKTNTEEFGQSGDYDKLFQILH